MSQSDKAKDSVVETSGPATADSKSVVKTDGPATASDKSIVDAGNPPPVGSARDSAGPAIAPTHHPVRATAPGVGPELAPHPVQVGLRELDTQAIRLPDINMPSLTQALLWMYRNQGLAVVIGNGYRGWTEAQNHNDRWVHGLRPVGDAVAPALDDLFSSRVSTLATQSENELLDMIAARMNDNDGLKPIGFRPARLVDREFVKKAGRFFMEFILPMLMAQAGKALTGQSVDQSSLQTAEQK